tara:strand:+ start:7959 stop:8990 length:1032 start_codon:yes stop_codon:yes gene_type:complete
MAITPNINPDFKVVTWEDLDDKAKEDFDFWTKFKEEQEQSLKDYTKTFEEFKIDGETLDKQPPKVKHAKKYIDKARKNILDAKIEISNLFAEFNFEVGGLDTKLTEAEIESLTPEQLEKYKKGQGRKTTAGMVKDIKAGAVYSFSPDDPPGGTNISSTGALQGDEGVKGNIQVEVENKLGLGAGALNAGAKVLDPIGEVIEDAVLALGTRLGIPGIAVAFKALMFYEAANLVGTGIKLLGNKIGRESGAFEGPEYGDWDTELADNSIWGEMYDLIDEEEVKKLVEDPKNNWELTEEDLKDIEGYMDRSVYATAWEKIDKEFGFQPPSGLDLLSGLKNMMTGTK